MDIGDIKGVYGLMGPLFMVDSDIPHDMLILNMVYHRIFIFNSIICMQLFSLLHHNLGYSHPPHGYYKKTARS